MIKLNKIIYSAFLLFFIASISALILFPGDIVLSQTKSGGATGGLPNPIVADSFTELLERIIGYLIVIGAPILALMVLYGGFYILTAGGNPEKFKTGKDVILYAVIGYTIILVSWGIIYIIGEILGAPDLVNKIK